MDKKREGVVIIGLGYVGLTLAVVMAERGFRVYGVEINKNIVKILNRGKSHFFETDINLRLKRVLSKKLFSAHHRIPKAKNKFNNYIITVGTPLNKFNRPRVDMIERATKEIAQSMEEDSHIILRSTVKIGTTRNIVMPILKKSHKKFSLSFCPERTLEGDALSELEKLPQIISGINNVSMQRSEKIFQKVTSTTIKVSNVETAETIKLVDNTYRDLIFAYSNEIAMIADKVGANVKEVVSSGKKDYPRTNVPIPGLVGGPCLSKDSYILNESLKKFKIKSKIVMSARKTNEFQPTYVSKFLEKVSKKLKWPKNIKIALLGLAFKGVPETSDLRGSMSIKVIENILKVFPKAILYGYDRLLTKKEVQNLSIKYSPSISNAMKEAHLVLILNNHNDFQKFKVSNKTNLMKKNSIVYDFWNTMDIDQANFTEGVNYISLGNHALCLKRIESKS
jgi:UDP-N-acetyl-D-mannosaminuronic acid dehydrogenase